MGKSKKRTITRVSADTQILKREEIIKAVISDIRCAKVDEKTIKHICLFGITAEELSEAGALYEEISAVKHLLS